MSLLFMDSMSRYGSTDVQSAVPFMGRKGWLTSGSAVTRTARGLFGQSCLAIQGFYDSGNKTHNWGHIQRTFPSVNTLGLSCKFAAIYGGASATHLSMWQSPITFFVSGTNGTGRSVSLEVDIYKTINGSSASTFVGQIAWAGRNNGAIDVPQTGATAIENSNVTVTSTTGTSLNTAITSMGWYTVDMLYTRSTGVMQWVITTPLQTYSGSTQVFNPNAITGLSTLRLGTRDQDSGHRTAWLFSDVVLYTNDGVFPSAILTGPRARTIRRLTADGNGHYNQWTPSSGANHAAVSETPYNDSTHSRGLSVGSKQTFSFTGLGTGSSAIKTISAIQVNADMIDSGASVSAASPIQTVTGSDSSLSSNLTVSRSNVTNYSILRTTNPATGQPYTVAEIEALDVGFTVA